jgi:DNA-binding transcriptional ArsR family regulator
MLDLNAVGHALSSPIRTGLLAAPSSRETLGEAAERLGVSTSTLSHHVAVLEEAGLVVVDKVGTRKFLRPKMRSVRILLVQTPADF